MTYRQVTMYLQAAADRSADVDADAGSAKMPEQEDAPNDISRCTGAQARKKLERLGLLGGF